MLRRKDRAAVLIGQNRGLVSADLLRIIHDFSLVKADQRAEHGHIAHRVRAAKTAHGLAGNLPQRFTGDQRRALGTLGNGIGNAHHVAAHQDGELAIRALLIKLLLKLGKRHNVQADGACVCRDLLGKVDDLLLGLFRGEGKGMVMDCAKLHAALGDHVSCNR